MFFFKVGYENPQSALGFYKCAFQACMGAIQRVQLVVKGCADIESSGRVQSHGQ